MCEKKQNNTCKQKCLHHSFSLTTALKLPEKEKQANQLEKSVSNKISTFFVLNVLWIEVCIKSTSAMTSPSFRLICKSAVSFSFVWLLQKEVSLCMWVDRSVSRSRTPRNFYYWLHFMICCCTKKKKKKTQER